MNTTSRPRAQTNAGKPRPPRRTLKILLAGLGLFLVLVAVLAGTLLFTEPGARLGWRLAERMLGGRLSGELAGGTLADGLRLRNVVYRDEQRIVRVNRADGAWHISGSPPELTLQYLRMGTVDVTTLPERSPKEPASLPNQITLPMAVDLRELKVDELLMRQSGAQAVTTVSDIALHGKSDGAHHAFALQRAITPYGTARANLNLDGSAPPFPVDGAAQLDGTLRDERFEASLQLSGSLRQPIMKLKANAAGAQAKADVSATPFDAVPLRNADIAIRMLNPKAFNPDWPEAELEIEAKLAPTDNSASRDASSLTVTGPVDMTNRRAGPLDQKKIPLLSAHADVVLDVQQQKISSLRLSLPGDAMLSGSAIFHRGSAGRIDLRASGLDLHAIHTRLHTTHLDGPATFILDQGTQSAQLQLADPQFSVQAALRATPQRLDLDHVTLQAGASRLQLSGQLERDANAGFQARATLTDFNPASLQAALPAEAGKMPQARINMELQAEGHLQPKPDARIVFDIHDSRYAGLPMSGNGTVLVKDKSVQANKAFLTIAGNHARFDGAFGAPDDKLQININAPALARLGYGLSGAMQADGSVAGSLDAPAVDARFRANNLTFGRYRAARIDGQIRTRGKAGEQDDAPLILQLAGRELRAGGEIQLEQLDAHVDGTNRNHTIRADVRGRLRGLPLALTLGAQGRLRAQPEGLVWSGTISKLENRGVPQLALQTPLTVNYGPHEIGLGATRLTLEQARIELDGLRIADGAVQSAGRFRALQVARMLELQRRISRSNAGNTGSGKPPIDSDLVLDGNWNFKLAGRGDGFIRVDRRAGDLRAGGKWLGLNGLNARAELRGQQLVLNAHVTTRRMGNAHAQGQIALQKVDNRLSLDPAAPLSGALTADVPRLETLGLFTDPGIAVAGRAEADLKVTGTLSAPRISGTVSGDALGVTVYDQGIQLRDGTVRIGIDNSLATLRQFEFRAGDGTLRASGKIPLDAPQELSVSLVADHLQLLSHPGAKAVLSGRAEARNVDRQLQVTGDFVVDRALFNLPDKRAPQLDDDVVVLRGDETTNTRRTEENAREARRAGLFSPRVDIRIGLGDHFRFEGGGADLRLAGAVDVRSAPGEIPAAYGTVRVAEGSFEAFGAKLAVERGVINFQGPLDNPTLNILAMRRDQDVAAGVNVTGSARQPRVLLVSEPNVPDEEKLSWLVFGRAPDSGNPAPGQAQAAAKSAALGLLNKFGGNRIAQRLGLDELSIGKSEFGLTGEQVINLGKEISDRLYIGYEQSLAWSESVLKLTYELSRSWSVVIRGGAVAGIDLAFSKRFDAIR